MTGRVVTLAANRGYALTSSRSSLIRRFLDSGWRVVLITADDAESRSLEAWGAQLEPVAFDRGGLSPVNDLRAYRRLASIYRQWRPTLIQHFHAKPVIFGTLAARAALGRDATVVDVITGLGNAFVAGGVAARLAGIGYGRAMPKADTTVFQNRDDRDLFLERGWSSPERARLIAGSGVDTGAFTPSARTGEGTRAPTIVMLARLLRQKGIGEFAEVARRIRRDWPEARFMLAGEEEPGHPDGMTAASLSQWHDVEYVGRLSDVRPVLAEADLFLFPSYYREGVPRVVLEAAAMGLPVVAFDVPGVREAVRDGDTGYLVRDRDTDALVERVGALLADESKRGAMGRAARRMAEDAFDVRAIEQQYLDVYRELGFEI